MAERAVAGFGPLDFAVNNAAPGGTATEMCKSGTQQQQEFLASWLQ